MKDNFGLLSIWTKNELLFFQNKRISFCNFIMKHRRHLLEADSF